MIVTFMQRRLMQTFQTELNWNWKWLRRLAAYRFIEKKNLSVYKKKLKRLKKDESSENYWKKISKKKPWIQWQIRMNQKKKNLFHQDEWSFWFFSLHRIFNPNMRQKWACNISRPKCAKTLNRQLNLLWFCVEWHLV